MWAAILSDRLAVVALVSRYLTNKLIAHEPLPNQKVPKDPYLYQHNHAITLDYPVLASVSRSYPNVRGTSPMYYSPFCRSNRRRLFPERIGLQAFALDLQA
jgi:hypothetical protein